MKNRLCRAASIILVLVAIVLFLNDMETIKDAEDVVQHVARAVRRTTPAQMEIHAGTTMYIDMEDGERLYMEMGADGSLSFGVGPSRRPEYVYYYDRFGTRRSSFGTIAPRRISGVFDITLGGQVQGQVELLAEEDDDRKLVTYYRTDENWQKSDWPDDAWAFDNMVLLTEFPIEVLAMEPEPEMLNGTRTYCVTGAVSGEDFAQLTDRFWETLGTEEAPVPQDPNLENVTFSLRAYVDAKTFRPLREEWSVSGLEGVLPWTPMADGTRRTLGDVHVEIRYIYDQPSTEAPEPEAPQRQKSHHSNPGNGDGTYTLQSNGYRALVTVPTGYTVEEAQSDYMAFRDEENDHTVTYYLWDIGLQGGDGPSYFQSWMDNRAYAETGSVDGPKRLGWVTTEAENYTFHMDGLYRVTGKQGGSDSRLYYAWAYGMEPVWVFVNILDGGNTSDPTLGALEIRELLGSIEPCPLPGPSAKLG